MIKNLNIVLLIGVLFLSSCGDDDVSYNSGENPTTTINYPSVGDGTFETPYMIGSGLYEFKGEQYYAIDVKRDDCNVLLYGVTNFDSLNDATFIDAGHNSAIDPNSNYIYEELDRDRYNIIVDRRLYSKFGVLSTCIDETYGATKHIEILEDNDRVVMSDNNILYKFTMLSTAPFSLNTTGDNLMIKLYNNEMVSVYSLSSDKHSQTILAGEYYMLLSKIGKNDINFVFNID